MKPCSIVCLLISMKVKNTADHRVGIVGYGDIKAGAVVDLPKEVWKEIQKPWGAGKGQTLKYRCEEREFLEPKKKPKKAKKTKAKKVEKEKVKGSQASPIAPPKQSPPVYFSTQNKVGKSTATPKSD